MSWYPTFPTLKLALLLLLLLLLLLAVKLLVPIGWMPVMASPGQAETGMAIMMPCPGSIMAGANAERVAHKSKHGQGKDDHTSKGSCPYGALHAMFGPEPVAQFGITLTSIPASPHFITLASVGRGLAAPPPPATGPPLLS